MALTSKQEKFAQEVAKGLTQADAYRAAYNAGKMKHETIASKASILMADGNVRARVEEIRKPIIDAVGLTLEAHLKRLEELSKAAESESNYGPAVSAEVARGKAAGLYIEKIQHDGNMDIKITSITRRIVDTNGTGN